MYTRCPSCRAQISFELPQSADSFPEGYKHKIKCPSCGVTIGVKIPRVESAATVQPTYTPANPAASEFEPTYQAAPPVPETKAEQRAEKKANKKSGLVRNIFVMLFSLLFVALSTIGYLAQEGGALAGKLPEWMGGIQSFDGISFIANLINNFDAVRGLDIKLLVAAIFPTALFILAGVNFIVALISCIGKKYGRAWNLISSVLIAALAILILLGPIIMGGAKFVDYFKNILDGKQYFLLVGAGLGILQLIFALCFCASLERKAK